MVFRHLKAVLRYQKEIQNLALLLNPQSTPFLSNLYKNDLTTDEIHQCILEMVLAGTDTSSVSLYYTILLLTEHKSIQHQLLDSLGSSDDLFLEEKYAINACRASHHQESSGRLHNFRNSN